MAFTIAVAGKGGTGKTTIAAMLAKSITENNLGTCLAIDADPNSNLAESLGINSAASVGELIDSIANNPSKVPVGMTKQDFIELEIHHALSESNSFDLLSMGRPEGPGCYCYANNVLRDIVGRFINQYKFCIIDNEAGMEHLSRRIRREADFFILVTDATKIGMHSAVRIRNLIDELNFKFKKIFLFINKVRDRVSVIDELSRLSFYKVYELAFDEEVLNLSIRGEPILKVNKNCQMLKKIEEFRRENEFRTN